jgi:hypothetical protein
MVKTIKIKNPLMQEFHGSQGIYTQRNMEKMRSYNLPQWKATCEQEANQPPAKRGEKRRNADKVVARSSVRNKKVESSPMPESAKRKSARTNIKQEPTDHGSNLTAPPTPTSPDVKPAVLETDDAADGESIGPDPTPSKPRRGRKPGFKPGPKPKGRQPKSASAATRKDAQNGAETTVAARRLRNVGAAADEIDEEAFEGFDYRVYDNDQWTADRCEELEEKYWKSMNFSNPMYAADMPGSLFDSDTTSWNVAKLPNLLDLLGQPIPGVNTAYLYLGMWRATFAWHLEDVDLYSINYIHFGAPKQWYSISQKDAPKFEAAMKSIWTSDSKNCDQFLRHKTYLVSPTILKTKFGVTVNKVVHREGQFVITFPIGYHSGYNLGYNCAESVNFAIENWLQYGKTARKCQCEADSVFIDVDWFVRKMNGEPTPEFEEVEVTDDEDDLDEPTDLPTPPGSDRGKVKMPQKRKRGPKDAGSNKKVKKIVKIRKISRHQPCCLCPNDFAWEELLPTSHGQKAHRTCAMYTPETYIATKDGAEMIFNVENISKARMELKCYECRLKKGSCFQCSSAKCAKSYHATCAMQAGVQVDKGEIAVWHEGIEYRDIGFDWRCRLHRTVKRQRITSELSACNHTNNCWENAEFTSFIHALKPGELIQYQPSHADEIEAGVVMSSYDGGQGTILVAVLPEQKLVKEVEASSVLFVDSSTSCLQKPSAAALDLPEELQGKTASSAESTERKPSEGDPFTEDPKTEWAEFVSNEPPPNKAQQVVDLTKPKQVWHYLGKTSTDSKAHFTADPQHPFHDSASVFLDTVDPPSKPNATASLQPKRHSLAASFPLANIAARNAATVKFQRIASSYNQPGQRPVSLGPSHHAAMNAARDQAVLSQIAAVRRNSQHRDTIAGQEAKANEQARILLRQQAKAQQLDMHDRHNTPAASGIGIDQDAVDRQRQFQQLASLQSRIMDQPRHMSDGFSNDVGRSANLQNFAGPSNGHQRAPQPHYSNEWMVPSGAQRRTSFGQPLTPNASLTASPSLRQHTASQLSNQGGFPSYVHQSHVQFPYQGPVGYGQGGFPNDIDRFRSETARIESIRVAANQPPPPPPSAAVERQRRISNPAYPFKSPDQIKAQKEAEKNSPPGSRPGSSYMQASPILTPEGFSSMDPQNPPQFINPNATQISPPGSSAGRGSTGDSISGTPIMMGPPLPPPAKRSMGMATTQDSTTFPAPMMQSMGNYIPCRSIYDPLYKVPQPMPQPVSMHLPPQAPMAEPAPALLAGLEPRATTPNGLPINDRTIPEQLLAWQAKGGFWGKVANYYIIRHQVAGGVYRSPFLPESEAYPSLAERYYSHVSESERKSIDAIRQRPTGR